MGRAPRLAGRLLGPLAAPRGGPAVYGEQTYGLVGPRAYRSARPFDSAVTSDRWVIARRLRTVSPGGGRARGRPPGARGCASGRGSWFPDGARPGGRGRPGASSAATPTRPG